MPWLKSVCLVGALCALTACSGSNVPDSKPASQPSNSEGRGFLSGLFKPSETDDAGEKKVAQTSRPRLPAPLARAAIAGGDVVVAGPDGYCVDPTTLQSKAERGFAIIASCNILSNGRLGDAVPAMLVSVTVGPRGDAGDLPRPREIAAAADAPLLAGESLPNFVVAHLARGGQSLLPDGDDRHWRGAFVLGDRLVGLALYAPKGSSLAGQDGGGVLARVRAQIVSQSSGTARPLAPAKPKLGGKGLFGRLFNR